MSTKGSFAGRAPAQGTWSDTPDRAVAESLKPLDLSPKPWQQSSRPKALTPKPPPPSPKRWASRTALKEAPQSGTPSPLLHGPAAGTAPQEAAAGVYCQRRSAGDYSWGHSTGGNYSWDHSTGDYSRRVRRRLVVVGRRLQLGAPCRRDCSRHLGLGIEALEARAVENAVELPPAGWCVCACECVRVR